MRLQLPVLALIFSALIPTTIFAQQSFGSNLTTETKVLANAKADECFEGIGGNTLGAQPPCSEGAQEKVNEAYVWGMTLANNKIFFGTVANTHCLVIGTFLQSVTPILTEAYVCEFGDSPVSPPIPAGIGDYRPPNLYVYDRALEELQDLSARMLPDARMLLANTLGIRAAGSKDGVVLFGGVSLTGGVNFFAFSDEGVFLDARTGTGYTNIRTFKEIDGELYAGVGFDNTGDEEGRILKWVGDSSDPIGFEVVGVVGSEVAELAGHDGRVFVTTWPDDSDEAGLYMSPEIGTDGALDTTDSAGWTKVFTVSDYEANPISAAVYGLGALASFDGYLFWGTMHVPGTGVAAHNAALNQGLPGFDTEDLLLAERSISIFRGRAFDTTPDIDLLYGYAGMPVLDITTGDWDTEINNNLNQTPLFGGPGFNNFLNNYTWTMAVYDDRLWVGTMDVGGLITYGTTQLTAGLDPAEQALVNILVTTLVGADLWFFPSATSPAIPETLNGAGNPANYGFRTMETDGDHLFIGTANPMNLLTGKSNRSEGQGGWELLSLERRSDNTPMGDDVTVVIDDSASVTFCLVTSPGITGVVGFGRTQDEAVLIATLNAAQAEEIEGPVPAVINRAYTVASSAIWSRSGRCESDAALNLTFDEPLFNASLVRISIDPENGEPTIEDVTLGPKQLGFSNSIRGDISQDFVGIIVLLSQQTLSLSASSIDFGSVLVGKDSTVETITLTNGGPGALTINQIILAGTHANDFAIQTNSCDNQTLASTATCTIGVRVKPEATGTRSASLSIPSDAASSPDTVTLQSTGFELGKASLSVSSLDFGFVIVGISGDTQTITVTNKGPGSLTIGQVALSGAHASDFRVNSDGCSNKLLGANVTCSVTVEVFATQEGVRSGTLTIPSDANTETVALATQAENPLPVNTLTKWWLALMAGLFGWLGWLGVRRN